MAEDGDMTLPENPPPARPRMVYGEPATTATGKIVNGIFITIGGLITVVGLLLVFAWMFTGGGALP